MIIDCISDLHGDLPKLQGGDILIVAGDLTAQDKLSEYEEFFDWFREQKYEQKVLIAGNHDNQLQKDYAQVPCGYLEDSGLQYQGINIWGTPWTKRFAGQNPHCMAFSLYLEEDLQQRWDKIPIGTEILVTHSPPYGVLDECPFRVGSKSLDNVRLPKLKLHVFGHIHEGYGTYRSPDTDILYVNASQMNKVYEFKNKPIRIERKLGQYKVI